MADDVAEAAGRLITGKQIKDGTVTTADVRDRSLLARDFAKGQLPRGPQGPQGERGEPGTQGERGEPGTSAFESTLPSGETVRGFFGHQTPLADGKRVKFGVSLPVPAPAGLSGSDVNFAAGGPIGMPVVTAGWFAPMAIGAALGPIMLLVGLARAQVVGSWVLAFPAVILALSVAGVLAGPLGTAVAFGLAAVLGAVLAVALWRRSTARTESERPTISTARPVAETA